MKTKVKFIKNHLEYKAGQSYMVDKGVANYLVRVGTAIIYQEERCSGVVPVAEKAATVSEKSVKAPRKSTKKK